MCVGKLQVPVVFFFALMFIGGLTAQTTKTSAKTPPDIVSTQQEVALLFSGTTADERILLTLNNNHPRPLDVSLTAYTVDGTAIALPDVQLIASESRVIELAPVLQSANVGSRELGWLQVRYVGGFLGLGMQLTLYPDRSNYGVDSPRSLAADFVSGQRHSVSWFPNGSEGKIVFTNASSAAVNAGFRCGAVDGKFTVEPRQTVIKRLQAPAVGSLPNSSAASLGCDVTSAGPVSALRVSGTVWDGNGYAAPMRFYDTVGATSTNLTAPGLRTSVLSHIVVRNISNAAVVVTPTITEAKAEDPSLVTLPEIILLPDMSIAIETKDYMEQMQRAGIETATLNIRSQAPKGTLVGSVTQIDASSGAVEDIPLRTGNVAKYARGIYPLRWDGDYTNLVTVTNTADTVRTVRGYITAGTLTYMYPKVDLQPGATKAFDVDEWRRDAVPDMNGKTLPKDAVYGKFFWLDSSQGRLGGLMGRNSVASLANHRRSSFSCGGMCANGSTYAPYLAPDLFISLAVSHSQSFTVYEWYRDPYGNTTYTPLNYETFESSLESNSNPEVASLGPNSDDDTQVVETGVAPGTTHIVYYRDGSYYEEEPETTNDCQEMDDGFDDGGDSDVTPMVTINSGGDTTVTSGAVDSSSNAKSYHLTASGTPSNGTYTWSISNGSGHTLTNTSSATVSMVGTASGTPTVSVMYSINGQNSQPATQMVTVLKPDHIKVNSDSSGSLSQVCPAGNPGIERILDYSILANGQVIIDAILMKENVPPTTDSCGVPIGTGAGGSNTISVLPNNGHEFYDLIDACPAVNPVRSCSWSFANQVWQQKNADSSFTSIGTVGTVTSDSTNGQTVAGHSPTQFLTGTIF